MQNPKYVLGQTLQNGYGQLQQVHGLRLVNHFGEDATGVQFAETGEWEYLLARVTSQQIFEWGWEKESTLTRYQESA